MTSLLLSLFFLSPPRVLAAFEDYGFSARAAGLAGAFGATEGDVSCLGYNPAGIGSIKSSEFQGDFSQIFRIPSGAVDIRQIGWQGAVPNSFFSVSSVLGLNGEIATVSDRFRDKKWELSYATYRWLDWWGGVLDWGIGAKVLSRQDLTGSGGKTGAAVDLGGLYRFGRRRSLGLSVLNVNQPDLSVSGFKDRAPIAFKLGLTEKTGSLLLSLDGTERQSSGSFPSGYTVAAGAEYGWLGLRHGSLAARTGLSLGNSSQFWAIGWSYRILGAELHYAVELPLVSHLRPGHRISLAIRFGEPDPGTEYERVLEQELKYRQGLRKDLEDSSRREEKLVGELSSLRGELEALRRQLRNKSGEASQAQQRLRDLMGRHQEVEKNLRELKESRRRIKSNELQSRFRRDWASYEKLNTGGAPGSVLAATLERIIKEYQGTGIDLTQAQLRLRDLLEQSR